MASGVEVAVFVDTSLGTHTAITVSPHLSVAQFKRKFGSMHSNCYPEMGNIEVIGLMVKKKSNLYHLPESMPIKHAFRGSKKTWFLYIKVKRLNTRNSLTPQSAAAVHDSLSETLTKEGTSSPKTERICESISVSGIINKYFSVYDDEVTSNNSKSRVLNYAPKTPPIMTNIKASMDQKKSSGVGIGKRVIVAANNLGVSTSDKKPAISLCKYKCKEISVLKSSSATRHPVFELGEQ